MWPLFQSFGFWTGFDKIKKEIENQNCNYFLEHRKFILTFIFEFSILSQASAFMMPQARHFLFTRDPASMAAVCFRLTKQKHIFSLKLVIVAHSVF